MKLVKQIKQINTLIALEILNEEAMYEYYERKGVHNHITERE
jgi:serine kinase of HPr protein (carbohydrate metabolism regulator)